VLIILLNPIPELQHALLPPKCYEPKSMSPTLCSFVVFTLDSYLSLSGNLGMRHKQNVASLELSIDESNNLCGLKLTMVIICNSCDEIILNVDWEFQSRNGGLDCFILYLH
jgi:hypothetical protein